MKIIFIIYNITRSAGTEKATIDLTNAFVRKGFDVEIISLASKVNSIPFFTISDSVTIHNLGDNENKILTFLRIKKLLRQRNPDIICGTGHNISFFLPFIKSKESKIIALEHIDFESLPCLSKTLMRFVYPQLNAIVVLSDIAKKKTFRLSDKIVVIPNQVKAVEKESSLLDERIILVGRISKEKAYERLIPIAQNLQISFPNWRIDIYGGCDDNSQNELEELLIASNLKNVRIHPPVKNIDNEYLKSSIFMITSRYEAFPLVVLEAKSYGLPVIGFRNEGTEALIKNNEDGFIVDTEVEAFDKLKLLISDSLLRNQLAKKALKNVKEFEEEKITAKWIKLINQI